jgi:hypothetical protein
VWGPNSRACDRLAWRLNLAVVAPVSQLAIELVDVVLAIGANRLSEMRFL